MPTSIKISLDAKAIKKMTQNLTTLLSDNYLLYVKTQNFHWNIIDPRFYSLHKMLEEQYEQLAEANDIIAERIRMIGQTSPATMHEFINNSTLKEPKGKLSGDDMLAELLNDHDKMIAQLRDFINEANDANDQGTSDMMIQRLREHEKTAWMLRSHFKF